MQSLACLSLVHSSLFGLCSSWVGWGHLQVLHYGEWVQRAQRQQQRTVEISPQRGIIYDRNGQELAMTVQVDSRLRRAQRSPRPEEPPQPCWQNWLAKIPTVCWSACSRRRTLPGLRARWMAKPPTRIKSLGLRGIYFQKELKRFYPKQDAGRPGARLRRHGRHRAGRHRASLPEPVERREGPRGHHHGRASQMVWTHGASSRAGIERCAHHRRKDSVHRRKGAGAGDGGDARRSAAR